MLGNVLGSVEGVLAALAGQPRRLSPHENFLHDDLRDDEAKVDTSTSKAISEISAREIAQ